MLNHIEYLVTLLALGKAGDYVDDELCFTELGNIRSDYGIELFHILGDNQ